MHYQLNDHPLHQAIYDLAQEIEKLPPSEHATKLVVMAGALQQPLAALRAENEKLRRDKERLELLADCLGGLAKLLTQDDGADPGAYWIELTPEQARLIALAAEQQANFPPHYADIVPVEYCEHKIPKGYFCPLCAAIDAAKENKS